MKIRTTGLSFVGVCIVLGILLLTKTINIIICGAIFSIALATFGLFRQKNSCLPGWHSQSPTDSAESDDKAPLSQGANNTAN